jgi:hypothetical protein
VGSRRPSRPSIGCCFSTAIHEQVSRSLTVPQCHNQGATASYPRVSRRQHQTPANSPSVSGRKDNRLAPWPTLISPGPDALANMMTSWSQSTSTEGSGTFSRRDPRFSPTRKCQTPRTGRLNLLRFVVVDTKPEHPIPLCDSSWLVDLAPHARGIASFEPHEGKPTAPCALRQTPRCAFATWAGGPAWTGTAAARSAQVPLMGHYEYTHGPNIQAAPVSCLMPSHATQFNCTAKVEGAVWPPRADSAVFSPRKRRYAGAEVAGIARGSLEWRP